MFEIRNTGTIDAPIYAASPTMLANFDGANGSAPNGLTIDANGNLFGTASGGGANFDGTVFEINNTGTVEAPVYASTPTTLVSFNGSNGQHPQGVIADAFGDLFGTTSGGGANGDGTVFEINAGTASGYELKTLVSFNGFSPPYGQYPEAGLTFDANGNLFGTTSAGGPSGDGEVFELKNYSDSPTIRYTPAT